jgi:hypothetical protein
MSDFQFHLYFLLVIEPRAPAPAMDITLTLSRKQ